MFFHPSTDFFQLVEQNEGCKDAKALVIDAKVDVILAVPGHVGLSSVTPLPEVLPQFSAPGLRYLGPRSPVWSEIPRNSEYFSG